MTSGVVGMEYLQIWYSTYVISIVLAPAVHLFYVSQFLAIVKVSWARFDA